MFLTRPYTQHHSGCGVITHTGDNLKETLPLNLSEACGHNSCFETVKNPIGNSLYFENPFHTDFLPRKSYASSYVPFYNRVCIFVSIAYFHLATSEYKYKPVTLRHEL